MPITPNESKYQEIYNKKQKNPALSLAQLCKEAGTTYQSYNNWAKKHQKAAPSPGTGQALRITVQVSVEELAGLVMRGSKTLPVNIEAVLKGLPPQERKALAQYLGMMRLERVQAGAGAENNSVGEDASL